MDSNGLQWTPMDSNGLQHSPPPHTQKNATFKSKIMLVAPLWVTSFCSFSAITYRANKQVCSNLLALCTDFPLRILLGLLQLLAISSGTIFDPLVLELKFKTHTLKVNSKDQPAGALLEAWTPPPRYPLGGQKWKCTFQLGLPPAWSGPHQFLD